MPIELPPGTAAYRDDDNPPTSNRQLLMILGGLVTLIVGVIWLVGVMVNQMVDWIPPSVEQQLGALVVPVFERSAKPSPTQNTLNQLLDRLEAKLPDQSQLKRDYQVFYIPDDTVNALAIPGDRVILYKGLLQKMKSENELMMVMGHELGHFAHRDHLRSLGRNLVLQLALAAFFGDPGSIQAIASSGILQVSQAQFSQGQELEADEFGLTLLQSTYGHAAGATDFFEDLSKQEGVDLAFLRTHPTSRDRVAKLKDMIQRKNYRLGNKLPLPDTLKDLS
ncbi:MAG: M48 family metallopeptidase [Leptolyngbyaceae bacterium]|nr:M48 family metallopeptidase [Leptolyngbyaceae bacterium]